MKRTPTLVVLTLLVCLGAALTASPAAAVGTPVNVPGRDAAVALYDMGNGKAALFGFSCDGTASTRVKMWSGRLPVKRCKLAAGDFNSDGFTDAMVLVDLGRKRSRMLLFASNGKRFTQVAKWTSKRGAFNSAGASLAVGGFAKNAIDGTLVLRRASTGWVCDRFALQGKRLVVRRVLSKPGVAVSSRARLLAGEIDGDFRDEAVIASPSAAGLVLTMYRWNDVALTPMGSFATGLAVPARLWTCGDIDGDGLDEPLALVPDPATPGSSSLSAFNWDSGAFIAAGVVGDVAVPAAAQLGCADLNGDGFSDVLALGSAGTGRSTLTVGVTSGAALSPRTFWTGKMNAARTRFACRRTLPIRVSDQVVVLPQTLDSGIVSRSDDNATIVFDGAPAEIAALEPGNVIILSPSATLPGGICRIVEDVTSDGTQTTVTTSFAALTDIFQQVDVNVHQENLIPAGEAVKGATTRRNGRSVELRKNIDYTVTDDSSGTNATFNMQGYLSLTFSGDISLRIRFPDHWYSPELYFMTYVQTVEKLDLDFAASAGYKKSFNSKLWEYTLPDILFQIGPVSFWLTPSVGIDAYATVDAKASVTWGFYQDATLKLGVEYCNGWKNLSEFSKTFSWDPLVISGKADAKAGVRFRCAILVYGIIGPTAATGPYVRMHANTAENPFWRMYAGVDATVGVRIDNPVHDVVGEKTYQYDWGPWRLYELQIAQASLKPGAAVTPEAPITSMITPLSNGWVKGPVILQFQRESDGTDPVKYTEWQLDGGAWQRIWPPDGDWRTRLWLKAVVDTFGVHTVGYRSIDTNGDTELTQTCVVRIDPVPPILTVTGVDLTGRYWSTTPVKMSLWAPEVDHLSGMAGIRCSVDGGNPTPGIEYWPLDRRTYGTLLIGEGVHQVSAISVDNAGNESPAVRGTLKVDSRAPTTLVPVDSTIPVPTSKSLIFTASDSTSGVAHTEYRVDGDPTWSIGKSVTVGTLGKTVVHYRSIDYAGNLEESRAVEVVVYDPSDVKPPTTTCTPDSLDYTSYVGSFGETVWRATSTDPYVWGQLYFRFEASDAMSVIAKIEYRLQSRATGAPSFGSWSAWETVSMALPRVGLVAGNDYRLEYRATDVAGNTEATQVFLDPSLTADYFRIERPGGPFDVTPPTTTCSPTPQQHDSFAQIIAGKTTPLWIRAGGLTISFAAADLESGVEYITYRGQKQNSLGVWEAWGPWTWAFDGTAYLPAFGELEPGAYRLQYRATDMATNVETAKDFMDADDPSETDFFRVQVPHTIDSTPPETTCTPGPTLHDWYTVLPEGHAPLWYRASGLTISFSALDDDSGVARIDYRVQAKDGSGIWGAWGAWTTGTSVNLPTLPAAWGTAGGYRLQYRATDKVGNVETTKAFVDASDLTEPDFFRVVASAPVVDTTPPVTTCSPDPQMHDETRILPEGNVPVWYANGPLIISFAALDAQSGVAKIEYRIQVWLDGDSGWSAWGAWVTGSSASIEPPSPPDRGNYRLQYRATDNAGNVETAQSFVDLSDPTETDYFYVWLML